MAETSLWSDDDQCARLAELTADTSNPDKELPLRRDVRSLGMLLGRVLVEQEGEAFYQVVERVPRLLIQHREQRLSAASGDFDDRLMAQAREIIRGVPADDAYRITKAFAIYFELTNLAETNHRKRRRRAARLQAGRSPAEGSFRSTLARLRAAGLASCTVLEALRKVKVTPVFTAHPTEITRHTIRLKRRRIARLLERLDQVPLSRADALESESQILAEITALWQTPEVLEFGSWIGGDRDGNPFVTASCTRDALRMARHVIIDHYIAEIARLGGQLSMSLRRIGASE